MSVKKINVAWPEWTVIDKFSESASGAVYRVAKEDNGIASYAAVKVISLYQSDEVDSLINEIKLMISLKGAPNIVGVEEYKVLKKKNKDEWDIFICMELLTPLKDVIAARYMSEDEVIKLGRDICTSLEIFSQYDIIHRDIRPENLFLSASGDFAVARELGNAESHLSKQAMPEYMAPELKTSLFHDKTVDIYSLGLVLYKLLNNNRLPFQDQRAFTHRDTEMAISRRFSGEDMPAPINASPEVAEVILAACAFNPGDRFQTATAFKNALGSIIGAAPSAPNEHRANPKDIESFGKKKSSKGKVALISIFAIILVGGAGVFALNMYNPDFIPGVFDEVQNAIASAIGDPVENVIEALDGGNFDEAIALAADIENESQIETLTNRLEERLLILRGKFIDGTREHSVVMTELNAIEGMNIIEVSTMAIGIRDSINELNDSRTAFNRAEYLYERGSFADAISHYMQVIQDDPNYSRALVGVTVATNALRSEALARAESYSAEGNYISAISILGDALLVIENDEVITQQMYAYRASMETANRQAILNTASAYANLRDWHNALTTLRVALWDMPGDITIEDRLRDYEQMFVDESIADAASIIAMGRHDDAIALLNNVLMELPNNAQITAEIIRIEQLRPASLADVRVNDSLNYLHQIEFFTDSMGSHHLESFQFNALAGQSYAVFSLDGGFRTFTVNVVAPTGLPSDVDFFIEVTLNDEDTPAAFIESFNIDTGMERISVDVTGATTMTISVSVVGDIDVDIELSHYGVHLVNAELDR